MPDHLVSEDAGSGGGLSPALALRRMTTAYWTSEVVFATAKLGIADLLAGEAQTAETLATRTGTHAPSLYRLLRAVASLGLLAEDAAGAFSLTPLGAPLRSDANGSMRAWSMLLGEPWFRSSWDRLLWSVTTGEPAFFDVHGVGPWEYFARNAEAAALFNAAMTSAAPSKSRATVAAYDFSRFTTVVDVGGGQGGLMATILAAHEAVRGILFDLPNVVVGAGDVLRERGVADRCALVGGDFFEAVPTGGDAYVLQTVIHDWEDEQAVRILRSCRGAMAGDATLLLVEQIIPTGNVFHPGKFDDLDMLVGFGGRERTADEFRALMGAAGFDCTGVFPTESQWSVIEGWPAER